MSPGRSPWLRQAASTTRGRVFGAADRLVRALGGRRKGRAPIMRVYLGADFDFWLLGLHTLPPDYRSDHRREYLPRGWDRIELRFVPNGPRGAQEGPGAYFTRVLGRR